MSERTAPGALPSRVPVEDPSQVPLARALAVRAAGLAGLSPQEVDAVALVATELAENLHRHAVGGELVLVPRRAQPAARDEAPGLWVLALDRGPGVERFSRCLVDGYSTGGTLGTGLGAARRMAASFDAVSEPGRGTVVAAGFGAGAVDAAGIGWDVAGLGFPLGTESVNGDGWSLARRGSRLVVLLADGLGHGPDAALASSTAASALPALTDLDPAPLLLAVHERLRGTRGAAVTVAVTDLDALRGGGPVTGVGLGNVSLLVAGPDGGSHRTATSHGTAGAGARVKPRPHVLALPAGGTLVLHTDGLTSRWDLTGRAELLRHGALLVCAALWRDHARGSDDSMVVVAKAEAPR